MGSPHECHACGAGNRLSCADILLAVGEFHTALEGYKRQSKEPIGGQRAVLEFINRDTIADVAVRRISFRVGERSYRRIKLAAIPAPGNTSASRLPLAADQENRAADC